MADLSHWDFADEFSASEAASLILGVDPSLRDQAVRAKPIFEKLRLSYHGAWGYWHTRCDGDFEFNESVTLPDDAIQSVWMVRNGSRLNEHGFSENGKDHFCNWIGWENSDEGEFSGFTLQTFSRVELCRWVAAIGMKSAYPFLPEKKSESLGTRERDTLLTIIGVLVELIQSPKLGRTSEAAVIKEMVANYSDRAGVSERTLQEKFASAKRTLQSN